MHWGKKKQIVAYCCHVACRPWEDQLSARAFRSRAWPPCVGYSDRTEDWEGFILKCDGRGRGDYERCAMTVQQACDRRFLRTSPGRHRKPIVFHQILPIHASGQIIQWLSRGVSVIKTVWMCNHQAEIS